MNERQRAILDAFKQVRFGLGPRDDRRFITGMQAMAETHPDRAMTPKQAAYLLRLAVRYKKQLPLQILEIVAFERVDPLEAAAPAEARQ